MLACTAWELLLKAKVLKDNQNDFSSIVVKDYRQRKHGGKTKKKHPKLNRCGNAVTLGLISALDVLRNKGVPLPEKCQENLLLLIEIRDNAVHLTNKSTYFEKSVQEVGTASLRNYMSLATDWFRFDFSRFNFYLMPLSFFGPEKLIESAGGGHRGNAQLRNVEKYLRDITNKFPSQEGEKFSVSLAINVSFVKSTDSGAIKVKASNDPSAVPIAISEDEFLARYPLDYSSLVSKLKSKHATLLLNERFFAAKKVIENNKRLCMVRLLDPKSQRSPRKKYYSAECITEIENALNLVAT